MVATVRMRRHPPAILFAVCFLAAGCTSLDPKERAKETATRNVRAEAVVTQEQFVVQLRQAAEQNRSVADLTTALRSAFDQSPDRDVLDVQVGSDRAARLEVVLHGRGEAGGGLSYESANVRLCVVMTGEVTVNATAESHDLSCPDDTPAPGPGTIDETVKLD
jgi:hypothetical protein